MATRRPSAALPARVEPQLATRVRAPADSDDWLHEIKFDGYRIGARVVDRAVTLFTRAGNDWTTTQDRLQRDPLARPTTPSHFTTLLQRLTGIDVTRCPRCDRSTLDRRLLAPYAGRPPP
ncbi:MAG: hypothetical protein IT294_08725 [Deltaproteobacteria bacterium]|nr:hypothetical protein [Deltaproteobacteria bacterium]